MSTQKAKFSIGDVVKHRHFDFRGVIYDIDFEFNNSEEWYQSIPKNVRPRKDQPFYHLLAENDEINVEAIFKIISNKKTFILKFGIFLIQKLNFLYYQMTKNTCL